MEEEQSYHDFDALLHLVLRSHTLEESDIGACLHGGSKPRDGLVEAA